MAKVILGVTISLDGFAEDSNGSVDALYPDLDTLRNTGVLRESIQTTGSVVMAFKEFAMAEDPDWFAGNYEYQVPIFVFTDKVPKKHPKETDRLTFTFVTDGIKSAIQQAKAVAVDKNVTIIGSASTTLQCIKAGLADELHIDIIPLFLKAGFRPFEDTGNRSIRLERIKVVELPGGRTHLRFRFVK
ncbi:MAG: dihydrofolate reductase family protein [Candidatus Methanoperedens sp.]|nr:dihydrofolate reductase family protein [Candidatus Methanoperedens sp.]